MWFWRAPTAGVAAKLRTCSICRFRALRDGPGNASGHRRSVHPIFFGLKGAKRRWSKADAKRARRQRLLRKQPQIRNQRLNGFPFLQPPRAFFTWVEPVQSGNSPISVGFLQDTGWVPRFHPSEKRSNQKIWDAPAVNGLVDRCAVDD